MISCSNWPERCSNSFTDTICPRALADEGARIGHKWSERVMQGDNIVGVRRRKFVKTALKDEPVRPTRDRVDHNLHAEEASQRQVRSTP